MQVTKCFHGALMLEAAVTREGTKAIVSENGQVSPIPNWNIAPASIVPNDTALLSVAGKGSLYNVNPGRWHYIPVSRCTLIGCLHEAGVPEWKDMAARWFSDNLETYRSSSSNAFNQPWLYRQEFSLDPGQGKHFLLETNGITSRADIFLNGRQIATKDVQSGAHGGHTYDITDVANVTNALVIKVYPTDYNHDLAVGFIDWNPRPPDNGTGVWRNVTIKQSGPVAVAQLIITTEMKKHADNGSDVRVIPKAVVRNLENRTVTVSSVFECVDPGPGTFMPLVSRPAAVTLPPHASGELKGAFDYHDAPIWWPKQWGDQPLWKVRVIISADGRECWNGSSVSDLREATFSVRRVSSSLDRHGDRHFTINNGQGFMVRGARYASDMFLRWDPERFIVMAEYMLDMGLNTIRVEGKLEQPELYEIADRLGLMVLPGWECCDKWEAWEYNDELSVCPVPVWNSNDYATANASIRHEAAMLQAHPSVLGFMIGSDFWPDDNATAIYVDALGDVGWETPIISSASGRGHPRLVEPSGMKMDGPYDWVPPNYWWDTKPYGKRRGAAFGFGSELGAGVGTPELGSLVQFLNERELEQLWQDPNASHYHMSTAYAFSTRRIYNDALWHRYGAPTSLEDYLLKAQMMDYEATRAQFEAYSAHWRYFGKGKRKKTRFASGVIYWMMNNAWPSLHWNLFDHYLHPGGAYFGAKAGNRLEHVAFDYSRKHVFIINHSRNLRGGRSNYAGEHDPQYYDSRLTVQAELIDLSGKMIDSRSVSTSTEPNMSRKVFKVRGLKRIKGVAFLRLRLFGVDDDGQESQIPLDRNVYWLSRSADKLDWKHSEWFYTPVRKYADLTALDQLRRANVSVSAKRASESMIAVELENMSSVPAVFIRLNLVRWDDTALPLRYRDVVPLKWSDNYVTLFPHETLSLQVQLMQKGSKDADAIQVSGKNVDAANVNITIA